MHGRGPLRLLDQVELVRGRARGSPAAVQTLLTGQARGRRGARPRAQGAPRPRPASRPLTPPPLPPPPPHPRCIDIDFALRAPNPAESLQYQPGLAPLLHGLTHSFVGGFLDAANPGDMYGAPRGGAGGYRSRRALREPGACACLAGGADSSTPGPHPVPAGRAQE
jgi:hypothetical protein